jgi:hypothetical protein
MGETIKTNVDPIRRLRDWGKRDGRIQQAVLLMIIAGTNAVLVQRYLGTLATGIYALVFALFSFAVYRLRLFRNFHPLLLASLFLLVLIGMVVCVLVLSPLLEGRIDRDSALITWWDSLLRGTYPYLAKTDLGNPISVLPFMPLLAFPFYLAGNIGYLEVLGFACLFLLLWMTYRKNPQSAVLSLAILSTAPLLWLETLGRSDLMANMALLLLLLVWVEKMNGHFGGGKTPALGVLIGCAGATRIALLPALFVVFVFLARKMPLYDLFITGIVSVLVFLVWTLPFAIWNPAVFFQHAPIGVSSIKLGGNSVIQIGWMIVISVISLLLGLAIQTPRGLFSAVAAILGLTVAATSLTYHADVSLLQLVFLPLLFALERGKPDDRKGSKEATMDRSSLGDASTPTSPGGSNRMME